MSHIIKKTRFLHSKNNICLAVLFLFITAIHAASWQSKAFTDWYRLHIFPIWTGTLGRASNWFAGSVGEILIIIGICGAAFGVLLLLHFIWESIHNRKQHLVQKKPHTVRMWYLRMLSWILVYIYGTETLNCFVMYHVSTVTEQYYGGQSEPGMEELIDAYTEVVARANALSERVQRDADGQAVYGSTQELYAKCKQAMQALGGTYPYLSGYYPDPKPIRASNFMSQQYLLGIYFPFTMEANYNTVMYPVNVPAAICHEYSHLKGIILEDEANYFGFIACIESEEPYLQYSGYLSVLGYLSRQVRKSIPKEIRAKMPKANAQVQKDDVFLTEAQWRQVEQKAVFDTETVNKAANTFLETNLTVNGIPDGIQSYSRVVQLVLSYYMKTNAVGAPLKD